MPRIIRTTARRVIHAMGRALRSYGEHMAVMDPSGYPIYPLF